MLNFNSVEKSEKRSALQRFSFSTFRDTLITNYFQKLEKIRAKFFQIKLILQALYYSNKFPI